MSLYYITDLSLVSALATGVLSMSFFFQHGYPNRWMACDGKKHKLSIPLWVMCGYPGIPNTRRLLEFTNKEVMGFQSKGCLTQCTNVCKRSRVFGVWISHIKTYQTQGVSIKQGSWEPQLERQQKHLGIGSRWTSKQPNGTATSEGSDC